jgi:RHS repeat-associated protein
MSIRLDVAIRRVLTRVLVVAALAFLPTVGFTAAVNISYLEGQNPVAPDAVATYGPDLFGDKVSLFNGALEFEHTDMSLPGNSALPVALVRKFTPGRHRDIQGQFGDWDLESPRIGGTFAVGWVMANGSGRCTGFSLPPVVSSSGGGGGGARFDPGAPTEAPAGDADKKPPLPDALSIVGFIASDYFQGVTLSVPGQGGQEVLRRAPNFQARPSDGRDYPLVTRGNWQIDCLPSIQNGAGEGFFAVSPEGIRYRFDWMASRQQTEVKKTGAVIGRNDIYLMATEVTDRFGNWVRYSYDPAYPLALTRIESNDGRVINITNSYGAAISATDGTRTFTYEYGDGLTRVNQPDGSSWRFNLAGMTATYLGDMGEGANCDRPGTLPPDNLDGTITHPSGATGTFETMFMLHGRTGVNRNCKFFPGSSVYTTGAVYPLYTGSQTIVSKSISGPGMQTMTWSYGFNEPAGWSTCTTCPDRKTVFVYEPGGGVTAHIFGIRWRVNEGQLLQLSEGWTGSDWLKTTTFRYRAADGQYYPDQFGTSLLRNADWLASRNRPQDQRLISQQGASFVWQADASAEGFDSLARPRRVIKYSSLGNSRSEATSYFDHLGWWVMGQIASVTETDSGTEIESNNYFDPYDKALKVSTTSYGKRQKSFTYFGDGTLASVSDAANRPTSLSGFRRGKPQFVAYPDGSSESQVVNNLGNADARTNAVGTTTRFEYDAMGRVARVIQPTGDAAAYHDTVQRFEQVGYEEYGLPAGHWRQTITTGNAVTQRFFDALWRERMEVRQDTADPGNTVVFEGTRFDVEGRKSFQSYPYRTVGNGEADWGKSWVYDALGREINMGQSSELGTLNTVTEYLAGFQRRVTNPRGYATTFGFQSFDTPSQDGITSIAAPEGVNVSINRDRFGKPNSITRYGTGNGGYKTATRSYTYDQHQRLCKTVEPETGGTVQQYDTAGNIQWRASGLTSTSDVCDPWNVPDNRKISYGYDPMNRLTGTTYGDGSPNITRLYTPDGLLSYSESSGWIWNYTYNNRRLLTREQYSFWGGNYPIDRRYNAYGHEDLLTYWGNIASVDHAPNALGQPTKAGVYASNVRWHPNGALAGYTLGNGITHTTTQNIRGLPDVWSDSGVMTDKYWYDPNGNVSYLEDWHGYANTRGMSYDRLDRLNIANGPWGSGGFQYDTLDNITASTVGGRILSHSIDAGTNRLNSLNGSQNINFAYDDNGNITQRGAQAYRFDIGNRMTEAVGKASYLYDAEGRRAWLTYADGTIGGTAYSRDGKVLISGHGRYGTNWYVYLGGRQIAEHKNTPGVGLEIKYIHTDALGSPVARTDANRAESNRTRYEPYGGTHSGGVPAGLELGYTGHVNDDETGLVYMQQRYYEPLAGRFLSVDPVVTDAKTGGHFNRYDYANNNPYRFTDPDGRVPMAVPLVVRIAAAIAAAAKSAATSNAGAAAAGVAGAAAVSTATDSKTEAPATPDPKSGSEKDPADKSGELTRAGRAQQKHGDRAGSAFDPAKGSPADKNTQGQQTLDSIVGSPDQVQESNGRGGTDVRQSPDGRGARFDEKGKFTGFIEPRRP